MKLLTKHAVRRMQDSTCFFVVLLMLVLLQPETACANPIEPRLLFPPYPPVFAALLVEVLAVFLLVRRTGFRARTFIPSWYVVNLISYYGLFSYPTLLLEHEISGVYWPGWFEVAVVFVEAVVLLWFSRQVWVHAPDKPSMTFRRALIVSFAGNVISIMAFFIIAPRWPVALLPEIYWPIAL